MAGAVPTPVPGNDSQVASDFLATRGRANAGADDQWIKDLAAGVNPGAPGQAAPAQPIPAPAAPAQAAPAPMPAAVPAAIPAPPAAAAVPGAPAPAPLDPSLPLGVRVEQAANQAVAGSAAEKAAAPADHGPVVNWMLQHGVMEPDSPLLAGSFGGFLHGLGENFKSMFTGPGVLDAIAANQHAQEQWKQQFKAANGRDATIQEEAQSPPWQQQAQIAQQLALSFGGGGEARGAFARTAEGAEGAEASAGEAGATAPEAAAAAPIPPAGQTSAAVPFNDELPDNLKPPAANAAEAAPAAATGEQFGPPAPGEPYGPPTPGAAPAATAGGQFGPPTPEGAYPAPAPDAAAGAAPAPAPAPVEEAAAAGVHFTNPEGESITATPEIADQARRYFEGESGANPVQASLETMASDPDMSLAIQRVASFIPEGAVKPDEELARGAYALGMQPADIMAGLRGALPSDQQIGAWAMLVNSGAEQVGALARRAVETGDAGDWDAATRAYALHSKIIGDWQAVGTEQGRAMRARQLAWDANSDYSKAFASIVNNVGTEDPEAAIRRIATLQDPARVSPFVSALRRMTGRQGLLYGWYNVLLSNPATVVKKLASDASVALWNVAARQVAGLTPGSTIPAGEAAALFTGYAGSMGDAIRAAGKAMRAGGSQFYADYQTMDGLTRTRLSLLANGAPELMSEASPTANALSYLRMALPTTWIGAADDFAKVANYRAEARALLYRQGVQRGLAGADLSNAIGQGLNNLPTSIHEQAVAAALRNTFQEPLDGVAALIQGLADANIPVGKFELPIGRIVMPFVKAPANIAKFAYRNSPLPLAFPSDAYKAEIAAGGATRDLALARVGLGTAATIATLGAAIGGTVTGQGPTNPELKRAWIAAGNQPYSIRAGGTWYGYNRLDPLAMVLGATADTVDLLKFARSGDAEQAAASLVFGMGNAMLSKTYMVGMSNFLEALQQPDEDAKWYADNLLASMAVPAGVAGMARAVDPWMRAHTTLLQTIESRIPGLSDGLPPQRTQWGDPVAWKDAFMPPLSGSGAARLLSPVDEGPADSAEPIDKWIWQNRDAFPRGPDGKLGISKPGRVLSFSAGDGISAPYPLDPVQHDRLIELAGNGFKDPATGLGAKDALNALVTGKFPTATLKGVPDAAQARWDRASPAEQAMTVQAMVRQYQGAAKQQLLAENPQIGQAVKAAWQVRKQQLNAGPAPSAAPGAPGASGGAMPQIGGGP